MSGKFRTGAIALVFALLLATVVGSGAVSAQGTTTTKAPGRWASSVNVQNLTNANNAITITFYNANGQQAHVRNDTLTPNQGKSYYLPAENGLPDGQYSAMVSSQGALKAVVNSESQGPNTGYSYNGIDGGEVATTLNFPGLYKNYYGFWSEVVLQNTTLEQANVQLAFNNGQGVQNIAATIPGNSSRVFALGDLGQLAQGNQQGRYSLVVTSNRALAGVANIWTDAVHGEAMSYNAFIGGTRVAYAPALYKNYYNFVSALTVQNAGGVQATGRVVYSNGFVQPFDLAPGAQVEFFQPNFPELPSGNQAGVFSARVEADQGNAQIVVLVTVEDKVSGLAASYNGSQQATAAVNVPVALKEYFGYFSAITVQNVGAQATTATVTFATGHTRQANIAPNGTYNFIQLAGAGDPLPPNTTTSAVVTSNNGMPLVAVVQQNNPTRYQQSGGGDFLFAYTASPQ
jgi:hypothetical protein